MPNETREANVRSLEQLLLMSASAIEGTEAADWLTNCEGDATINAHGGDDSIYAPSGTNRIDGGAGNDVLFIYEGKRSDYILQKQPDGTVLLEGVGLNNEWVSNTLTNVERISFRDGMVWVGDDSERVLNGSDQNDFLSGTEFTDLIQAFSGDDAIYAPFGVQRIDGGEGLDTLIVYEGRLDEYDVTLVEEGVRIQGPGLNGEQIDNLLVNVERILFNDRLLDLRELSPVPAESGTETSFDPALVDAEPLAPSNDGQPETEQPVADQPVAEQPAVDQPAVDQPEAEQPEAEQPEAEQPVAEQPEADQPAADQPAAEQPEADQPEADQPEADQPEADQPVAEQPVAEQPAADTEEQLVAPVPEFVQRVVDLTNDFRLQNGLGLLSISYELQQAAQGHSQDLATSDYFSHTGLDGRQPWDRAFDEGYDYLTVGENIAAGQLTPDEVVQAWIDSPPHLQNILNPDFTEIGVGYDFLQDDTGNINYHHYWTQLFGTEM